MVEDNEIKAEVSPFAVRNGEIKVFDGKDGYVSMNQILQKINKNQITDIHFEILNLLNQFEFLTSRQMMMLLELKNIEIADQDKLNKRLEQLVKCKIVTRYYFKAENESGIFRVYAMEKMGKYLLTSREIDCKWQPSDNAKPVYMIKQKLAGNQLIIAYLRKVKSIKSFELKPKITSKTYQKTFKPIARIDFNYNNNVISFVYEVIRRNEGWEKDLVDRMKLWKDFYDNFVQMDSNFVNLPQLVFVCEDERHTAEVFKTLVMNQINIKEINYYYTTDLLQNEENLEDSLYSFYEENGKYKRKRVSASILS